MRYGYFDEARREYVVERPDTPLPWVNYLGEDSFCGIVSNNAGGYAFRRSPGHGRLLRYRFNAVPYDRPGRYIYLREADGDYWSASWSPVQKPLDQQQVTCRHGMGYTTITSVYRNIEAEVTYFVPGDAELEIWRVVLRNRSDQPRDLDVFGYAEFAIPEFAKEMDLQCYLFSVFNAFEHDMVSWYISRARPEFQHAWFASAHPPASWDAVRESFIGPWRDEACPIAVERGQCANVAADGENGCGALHLKVSLPPQGSYETAFLLGSGKAAEAGVEARQTYTPERIEQELQDIRTRWEQRLQHLQCRTPDELLNGMVNVWGAYQAHTTFKWSRSASLIEAGGRDGLGYRDTMQDTMAVLHTSADRARPRIVDLLRGQDSNGSVLHHLQPLLLQTGRGERVTQVWSDDHLWILLAVGAWVRETGKLDFLEESVAWLNEGEGTVYEHARRALAFAATKTGRNGLLLGLCADWNDSLNLRRVEGESVFTSMLYCAALGEFAQLADALGRVEDAGDARQRQSAMAEHINNVAWDGEWYLRALIGDEKIGSRSNREAKIFLNTQTWAVMSGVADDARGRQAMDAARELLFTEHGMMVCAPAYRHEDLRIGGMTQFPPGQKENAAVFCHAHTWSIAAEALLGRGDRAVEYFNAFVPARMNDRAELRQAEPYVFTQFVKGADSPQCGQARNAWLTGTAAWAWIAATQYILGLQPALDGLRIAPAIPGSWPGFEAERRFRGATYRIQVENSAQGQGELSVDDRPVSGDVVPPAEAGRTVEVRCRL